MIYVMHEVNINGLDLNLIPALEALLRLRNVTHAAAEVGMSQPAMSRALARLRHLQDDPLLVRQLAFDRLALGGERRIDVSRPARIAAPCRTGGRPRCQLRLEAARGQDRTVLVRDRDTEIAQAVEIVNPG